MKMQDDRVTQSGPQDDVAYRFSTETPGEIADRLTSKLIEEIGIETIVDRAADLQAQVRTLTREVIYTRLRLVAATFEATPGVPASVRCSIKDDLERVRELVREATAR